MALPPLPAVKAARIEVLGPMSGSAKWGEAIWGQSDWAMFGWFDVTPQSMDAQITWGADDPSGVLTVPAAGSWSIVTYDPERRLDPSNGASPLSQSIRPGRAIRVSYIKADTTRRIIRQGLIDEVEYDLLTKQGKLRGTDVVQLMVGAKLPENLTGAPMTLRERAYWLIGQGGLSQLVPCERVLGIDQVINGSFEGTDILVNGSFEDGLNGWTTNANSSSYAWGGAANGGRVLRIIGSGATNPINRSNIYPAKPGITYTFSISIARNAGTFAAQARLDSMKNGVRIGSALTFDKAVGGSNGVWTTYTGMVTVPTDGTVDGYQVTCYINGANVPATEIMYFDWARLCENSLGPWLPNSAGVGSGVIAQGAAPHGQNILKLVGGTGYCKNRQSINAVPGGVYTMSGWMKYTGAKAPTMFIQPRKDGAIVNPGSPGRVSTVANQWEYFTTEYIVPLDGSVNQVDPTLTINHSASAATDIAYFDDIHVTGPTGEADPEVGPLDLREQSVWQHILTAAYDALYAVWLDAEGTLRFRSFGNPNDIGIQIGGVDGIAIDTLASQASLQGVFTRVIGYDMDAPEVPLEAIDIGKVGIYGDILLHRQSPVPNAQAWVESVLADRSGSGLQYSPGTLRPQTEEQFDSLIGLGMIDAVALVVESTDPPINVEARVLGGSIEATTESGWSAKVLTYIPANEWEEAEVPPIVPPEPPTGGTVPGTVRTYACKADSRLAHSASLDAGNGTDTSIAIGYISPYRNRAVLDFNDIPWGDVVSIEKAELLVTVGPNSCGAFGSTPKVKVSRLTKAFSEGTYAAACGFATSNAVKYPGPAFTSSGAVTKALSKTTGTKVSIDITAIARAWLGGSPQYGLSIVSAGEDSSAYTTAIYSRHHGTTANRPSLKLTMTVKA